MDQQTDSPLLINPADAQPGDVLLCFSQMMVNKGSEGGSGYSHATIALASSRVLEAASSGVRLSSIQEILAEYDHIAVLRNDDVWNCETLDALETFAKESLGKVFNRTGFREFAERKVEHEDTVMERVQSYFEGTEPLVESDRPSYFCSELVTSAFIKVGIIDAPAAIVFSPETISPEKIGLDKVFGFFCGYIRSHDAYVIPEGDYFRTSI